jgi:hypothetical protein
MIEIKKYRAGTCERPNTQLVAVIENSVRSENTGVPIIREIMVATTMSSLFVAFFALIASTFRTRAALQGEILALRHQLAVFQKNAPCRLRLHLFLAKMLAGSESAAYAETCNIVTGLSTYPSFQMCS